MSATKAEDQYSSLLFSPMATEFKVPEPPKETVGEINGVSLEGLDPYEFMSDSGTSEEEMSHYMIIASNPLMAAMIGSAAEAGAETAIEIVRDAELVSNRLLAWLVGKGVMPDKPKEECNPNCEGYSICWAEKKG